MAKNAKPADERLAKIALELGQVQKELSAEHAPPVYLTPEDIARRLRTSTKALLKIPALRALAVDLGGVLRWEPAAFERWLAAQQGRGAAA